MPKSLKTTKGDLARVDRDALGGEPRTAAANGGHTPGPWREGQDGNLRVYGPDGEGEHSGLIAEVFKGRANVRLIAAAPDLLAACEECVVAVAAAMRVITDLDTMKQLGAEAKTHEQRFVDEMHISGVEDGFGVRAQAAIEKARATNAVDPSAQPSGTPTPRGSKSSKSRVAAKGTV